MEKYKARNNSGDSNNNENQAVQKSQEQKNDENNANNLKNAADVAIASKNPYAMAVGAAVKAADKFSGGKATEMGGKIMSKSFKRMPGGNKIQNLSNDLNESGASDAIGQGARTVSSVQGNTANSISSNNSSKSSSSKSNSSKSNSLFGSSSRSSQSFNLFGGGSLFGSKSGSKTKLMLIAGLIGFFFPVLVIIMVAGSSDAANLATTNNSSMSGSSSSNIIIESSKLNGGNGHILLLNETLQSIVGEAKINEWNSTLVNDVISSGKGTGAAVAKAAYDFIALPLNEGIIIPYFYGGGHGLVSEGFDGNWGMSQTVTVSGSNQQAGSIYPSGLDCSGFATWAIKNAGCENFYPRTAVNFLSLGVKIEAENASPGDVAASASHVGVIVENTGTTLVIAEAYSPSVGIVLREYNYDYFGDNGNLQVVSMESYYLANCGV